MTGSTKPTGWRRLPEFMLVKQMNRVRLCLTSFGWAFTPLLRKRAIWNLTMGLGKSAFSNSLKTHHGKNRGRGSFCKQRPGAFCHKTKMARTKVLVLCGVLLTPPAASRVSLLRVVEPSRAAAAHTAKVNVRAPEPSNSRALRNEEFRM
jgi:hypothetical protein